MKRTDLIMYGKNFGKVVDDPEHMDGDLGFACFYRVIPSYQLEIMFPEVEKLRNKLIDIVFNHETGIILITQTLSEKKIVETNIYEVLARMKD